MWLFNHICHVKLGGLSISMIDLFIDNSYITVNSSYSYFFLASRDECPGS